MLRVDSISLGAAHALLFAHDMKMTIRAAVTILSALLLQGCATYMKGDLAERNLRRDSFPAPIASLSETGVDKFSARDLSTETLLKEGRTQAASAARNGAVDIALDYRVPDNLFQSTIMPLLTGLTLGLVPLYATSDADVHATVTQAGRVLLDATIDARAHTFYGWLAIYLAEKNHSADLLKTHEGQDTRYFVLRAARERSLWRISERLREKGGSKTLTQKTKIPKFTTAI